MDLLQEVADQFKLLLVEDACQAHGAEYGSRGTLRRAGTFGAAAAFSFYPGKNLGACGEAGAITTNDDEVARVARMLREHGQAKKYYHDLEGYNGRLDAIQAAFLRIKLRRLQGWNDRRRASAARYNELLAEVPGLTLPTEADNSRSVYHLYVARTADREALASHLQAAGISSGLHYPLPIHLQKCYVEWGYQPGDLPITEQAAKEILSLPMFPNLTPEQIARVGAQVQDFVAGAVAR